MVKFVIAALMVLSVSDVISQGAWVYEFRDPDKSTEYYSYTRSGRVGVDMYYTSDTSISIGVRNGDFFVIFDTLGKVEFIEVNKFSDRDVVSRLKSGVYKCIGAFDPTDPLDYIVMYDHTRYKIQWNSEFSRWSASSVYETVDLVREVMNLCGDVRLYQPVSGKMPRFIDGKMVFDPNASFIINVNGVDMISLTEKLKVTYVLMKYK